MPTTETTTSMLSLSNSTWVTLLMTTYHLSGMADTNITNSTVMSTSDSSQGSTVLPTIPGNKGGVSANVSTLTSSSGVTRGPMTSNISGVTITMTSSSDTHGQMTSNSSAVTATTTSSSDTHGQITSNISGVTITMTSSSDTHGTWTANSRGVITTMTSSSETHGQMTSNSSGVTVTTTSSSDTHGAGTANSSIGKLTGGNDSKLKVSGAALTSSTSESPTTTITDDIQAMGVTDGAQSQRGSTADKDYHVTPPTNHGVPGNQNQDSDLLKNVEQLCKYILCERKLTNRLYPSCKISYAVFEQTLEFEESLSHGVSDVSKVVVSILMVVIMVLAVCGNSLVVLTFIFNKNMRSITNVFILSLAVSDLMVAFTVIPIDVGTVLRPYWLFGQFGCKLMPFVHQFSVACSSLTLCCIAFDRYYAIVHPLKLKFLQTPRRAMILQVVVWLTSAAASIPYAVFFEVITLSACQVFNHDDQEKQICRAKKQYAKTREVFDIWVTLIVLFFGPFIFMSAMYSIICYKLWVQRPIGASRRAFDGRLKLKQRAIKMLITVVFIFVICWSPVLLFNAIAEINGVPTTTATKNWRAYLQCLSLSNTCWNPLVYAFMNEKFRSAFRTLITCRKGQIHPVIDRRKAMRASMESRKTTSQLETPNIATGSRQTSETKI